MLGDFSIFLGIVRPVYLVQKNRKRWCFRFLQTFRHFWHIFRIDCRTSFSDMPCMAFKMALSISLFSSGRFLYSWTSLLGRHWYDHTCIYLGGVTGSFPEELWYLGQVGDLATVFQQGTMGALLSAHWWCLARTYTISGCVRWLKSCSIACILLSILVGAVAGMQLLSNQNEPYTLGSMLVEVDADESAKRRKSNVLGHQTISDIISQDKWLWKKVV